VRRLVYVVVTLLGIAASGSAYVGSQMGPTMLHPPRLRSLRPGETAQMLLRTDATKENFSVAAKDGQELRGWKVHPPAPNGDWVLLYHGVGDNRTGMLGYAEFLLRQGYSLVMMDARAHGESGGEIATYGWKERFDTVAITDALYSGEKVRRLYAMGVSMGAALALQSAAVEPRIDGVVAEDPFANLREVSYDYGGLHFSPLLGKTLFRPATIAGMQALAKAGGFDPDEDSPEKAVAQRPFPILLICGTRDHVIPCRHAERIRQAARGPRELWIVEGAPHASAMGVARAEYEERVIRFLDAR
jgi:alpha-beta hydrolase superfamily lysophospholipase